MKRFCWGWVSTMLVISQYLLFSQKQHSPTEVAPSLQPTPLSCAKVTFASSNLLLTWVEKMFDDLKKKKLPNEVWWHLSQPIRSCVVWVTSDDRNEFLTVGKAVRKENTLKRVKFYIDKANEIHACLSHPVCANVFMIKWQGRWCYRVCKDPFPQRLWCAHPATVPHDSSRSRLGIERSFQASGPYLVRLPCALGTKTSALLQINKAISPRTSFIFLTASHVAVTVGSSLLCLFYLFSVHEIHLLCALYVYSL